MTGNTGGFELRGINHLALVCRDMERTVDFYTNVLGLPLVKTIELPAGMGQHFFMKLEIRPVDHGHISCHGSIAAPNRRVCTSRPV